MSPAPPLITLLTDFGTRDYFVASLKGVILTINPAARIVDLSHDIAPFGILEAAYCLSSSYRYFPDGTIHVAVVDPGVGSARRPILVKTSRYYFVAPDNGILTPVLNESRDIEIYQLENLEYQLATLGATFHGRDVFAPAAAWVSRGAVLSLFGRPVFDPVKADWPQPTVNEGSVVGQIMYADRFGNLITNLTLRDIAGGLASSARSTPVIRIAGYTIDKLVRCYGDGDGGAPQALINSGGYLEIFLKEGNAASRMYWGPGQLVEVQLGR